MGRWVLSQWWPSKFTVEGTEYHHAEGFMMAAKARLFGDRDTYEKIVAAEHPGLAKRLGREVTGFDEDTWVQQRYGVALEGNLAKFSQGAGLREYLLSTAPRVIVEASPLDGIWGIGLADGDRAARLPSEWRGLNLLGFALGEVRDRLAVTAPAGR